MKIASDFLGKWPIDCEEARRERRLIHIPKEKMLHLIHGKENHTQVSFFISNERVHVGIMTIPAGKFSDPEVHQGDEALIVLEGTLQIHTYDRNEDEKSVSHLAYKVQKNEKFLIPEGIKHQYFNLSEGVLKVLFTVAPHL